MDRDRGQANAEEGADRWKTVHTKNEEGADRDIHIRISLPGSLRYPITSSQFGEFKLSYKLVNFNNRLQWTPKLQEPLMTLQS